MSEDHTKKGRVYRIDLSPRYRYLREKGGGSGGGGMGGDGPRTVVIEEWEIGVVLTALSHELKDTIEFADGRDDGMVEYIKILSGVVLKLEEAHGGPAEGPA
jgi:hypothetical protein